MPLENKIAFITGANRGLGKGFVEYLLSQNLKVFAGMRTPTEFDQTLAAHPNLRLVQLDVTDNNSIDEAVNTVAQEVDRIDFLINNAGVNKDSATSDRSEEHTSELQS